MTVRQSVEDGILAALAPLGKDCDGGYLKALRPYNGSTTPAREDEDFQRVSQGELPCVLVATSNGTYENRTMGGRIADLTMQVHLLIASCNMRSGEARLRGDKSSADPGIYQMIEDIRSRLYNRPLPGVVGACRVRPIEESQVLTARDRTIWLLTYEAKTDVQEQPLDSTDQDLQGITSKLGFSQTEEPGAPDDVTEFDSVAVP